jgi:hypothetical protein
MGKEAMDEEGEAVRKAALEYMTSEGKSSMVKMVVAAIVRGCLGGISEPNEGNLDVWLESDVRVPISY